MSVGRTALLLVLLITSCARTNVDAVVSDPAEKPVPPAPPAPPPSPTDARVCEPPVGCGVWGDCFFFEPTGGGDFRGVDGAVKGLVYRRYPDCYPADAGPSGCTIYCSGPKGRPPCVDGLHPKDEICTGAAVPRPAPYRCEVRDGKCQRAP
jgi:hypothetical protein